MPRADQGTDHDVVEIGALYSSGVWLEEEDFEREITNARRGDRRRSADYEPTAIFAGSVLQNQVEGLTVAFEIAEDAVYFDERHGGGVRIAVDLADGVGWRRVRPGQHVTTTYLTPGDKAIGVRLTLRDRHHASYSVVEVNAPIPLDSLLILDDIRGAAGELGGRSRLAGGSVLLEAGCDGVLDRPVIVVEGFDPLNSRNLGDIQDDYELVSGRLRTRGYDMIYLNFDRGGADITDNARVVRRLIELLNDDDDLFVGSGPIGIIGESMGGVVSRIALREMELDGVRHNVNVFLSFDSPHRGANVPVGFQEMLEIVDDNWLIDVLNIAEDAIEEGNAALNSPAARQLLLRYRGPDPHPDYTTLQTRLNQLGFPSQGGIRNVALTNADTRAWRQRPGPGEYDEGDKIFRVNYFGSVNIPVGAVVTATVRTNDRNAGTTVAALDAFLFGVPLIIRNERHRFNNFNYDVAPGGWQANRGAGDIDLGGFEWTNISSWFGAGTTTDFGRERFCFVPLHSSVATNRRIDDQWDMERSVARIRNAGESPMIAIYGDEDATSHVETDIFEFEAWQRVIDREFASFPTSCPSALARQGTPPTATFDLSSDEGSYYCETSTIRFSVNDRGLIQNAYAYEWRITGPQNLVRTGPSISFTPAIPGGYTITLTRRYAGASGLASPAQRNRTRTFFVRPLTDPNCTGPTGPGGVPIQRSTYIPKPGGPDDLLERSLAKLPSDGLLLYPNPTWDFVHVAFEHERAETVQLVVRNAMGAIVYAREFSRGEIVAGSNTFRLDMPGLLPGTYFVQVRGSGRSRSSRFTIQN